MIAVNATIVGERPTGLGVYTRGLVNALRAQGEELDVIRAPRPMGHVARILWLQTAMRRRLSRSRHRVLLNPLPEGPLLGPLPQMTVVHDLIPLYYPAPTPVPRAHLYFRYVVPLLLRASRAVIADSEATRRDVLAHYRGVAPERVHVVHPGYDAERFRPADQPDDPGPPDAPSGAPSRAVRPRTSRGSDDTPYLLYVGNVAPHKNLVRLVEAFAALPRAAAALVIRGSGRPWHEAPVRKRIEQLGVVDRVDWRPYEDAATLPDLYRGARALVLPSLYEGFGLTALEAMACGTPVIAARAASIPEVVGNAALLVDPLDTHALAAAMSDLLGSDALAANLRARRLERARLFSWERTAEQVRAHLHPRDPRGR